MIRAMDRFYEKHPTVSFLIALVVVFSVMYAAKDWDKADTAALRLQMMAAPKGSV